ncbi:hypothetical protein [Streptomyces sp. A5-4]|uniref:hypothetical protein n=1 Tax=Streptomyces sp. A5-4 TaxID=3384771 RepID=UPI003DA95278
MVLPLWLVTAVIPEFMLTCLPGDEHALAERQRLRETSELVTHGGVQTALWGADT